MATRLPPIFRTVKSPVLASFDYIDIFQGTAYETYYAAKSSNGYILNTFQVSSEYVTTTTAVAVADNVYELELDIDFDITLGKSRSIGGEFLINVPVAIESAAGNPIGWKVLVHVRKDDGSDHTRMKRTDN